MKHVFLPEMVADNARSFSGVDLIINHSEKKR